VHSVDQPGAQAAADRTLAALASLGWVAGPSVVGPRPSRS
jgi:hypothetical protein